LDLYETYIRAKDGDTYHPDDIREGLKDFLGDNGYRISFNIEGVVITLRRDTQVDADMRWLDREIGSESVDCAVTLRGHKPRDDDN
jgi:hypothetical protein